VRREVHNLMVRTHNFEGVAHEIQLEEMRLTAIEDRLRRLELEHKAGEIALAIRALAVTRQSLLASQPYADAA
jgi:hypothetical protein